MWNYRRMCDLCREVCSSQKTFTNGLIIGLPQWAWVEKIIHGVEAHWLSCKEKVPGVAVSKDGHADRLLGHLFIEVPSYFIEI